ncbi:unnamed protein product, partial [Closterium sp. NIES-54]
SLEIALGVAEALQYMHGCHPDIIHRDVKTLNVFLDIDLHVSCSRVLLSLVE